VSRWSDFGPHLRDAYEIRRYQPVMQRLRVSLSEYLAHQRNELRFAGWRQRRSGLPVFANAWLCDWLRNACSFRRTVKAAQLVLGYWLGHNGIRGNVPLHVLRVCHIELLRFSRAGTGL
jgi:hypothetical protein